MPTNPTIPQSGQPQQNVNVLGGGGPINNIDATTFAKDIAKGAADAFIPNLAQLTGIPTIVDANSLGILIQGAGFGQVKRIIAEAAIRKGQALSDQTSQIQLKSDNPSQMADGYNQYFASNRELLNNPNSLIGGKLFDCVTFRGNYTYVWTIDDNGRLTKSSEIPIDTIVLNACIISIDANRNIHESVPVGADIGSIKEIMNFGEYKITMTGHLVNEFKPKEYNEIAILALDDLCRATTAVNVNSTLLDLLGINSIVITDYTLEQVEGFNGILTYTIKAISDTPITTINSSSNFGTTNNFKNPYI